MTPPGTQPDKEDILLRDIITGAELLLDEVEQDVNALKELKDAFERVESDGGVVEINSSGGILRFEAEAVELAGYVEDIMDTSMVTAKISKEKKGDGYSIQGKIKMESTLSTRTLLKRV